MATSVAATPPISFTRLKQIANDECTKALGDAQFYEHTKTEQWNNAIVSGMLRSLISESSPAGGQPAFKYAINSTIIQHLIPSSALNKPRAPTTSTSTSTETSDIKSESAGDSKSDAKPREGRRGLHSATGAYWNEKTDGMWSYKYEGGESKGLDVVISVIWIGL